MVRTTILITYLILGKLSYSQELRCDLFGYLHHDMHNKLSILDNSIVNVSLERNTFFDFKLFDSSTFFSSQANEIIVQPKDDIAYSIKLIGADIFLFNSKDTINLNRIIETLSNINIKDEFVSNRKIGKTSFLNVVYRNSKVDKILIISQR